MTKKKILIIGGIIAFSIFLANYINEDIRKDVGNDFNPKSTLRNQLEVLGFYISPACTDEMIIHLQKHSNIFRDHGNFVYFNMPGLPVGMDDSQYEECRTESSEKRYIDPLVTGLLSIDELQ